jgi:hypothetical protein
MATPRVAKLNIKNQSTDEDIEEDGQHVRKLTNNKRRKSTISRK